MGTLIREHRSAAGLSQRELADAASVTLGMLRDLEQGRTLCPRRGSVHAVATALGLNSGQRDQLMTAWNAGAEIRAPMGEVSPGHGGRSGGTLRIGILGPLVVTRSGQQIDLGPVRQRAALGLLVLNDSASVRLSELTDLFWGGEPPATARTIVQVYISRLRRVLGPARDTAGNGQLVRWTAQGYRLQADRDCQVDNAAFSHLARDGHDAIALRQHARACDRYERALSLWRGGALDDIEPLQEHPLVVELNIRRSEVILRYADAAAMIGAHGRVLPHLRSLCARDRLNEQAVVRLMIALAATGQRAAAMAEFRRLRFRLRHELGLCPDQQVARAYAQITGSGAGVAARAPIAARGIPARS